jgi:hypothetical protein
MEYWIKRSGLIIISIFQYSIFPFFKRYTGAC